MANTTSTKSTTTTKTTTKKEAATAAPVVDTEKEQLKAQLAEQQKRMEEMMAQMQVLMQAQSNAATPASPVNSNKQIKIINLTAGGLNLRGVRMHHIDNQFESITVNESEARAIVANTPNAITSGCVYIPDNDFMASVDMDGLFNEMLDDKQLKNLLNQNADEVCGVYMNATDSQKGIIVDMISNRRLGGIEIDANILLKLGELSGVNFLDIDPLEEE